MKELRNKTSGPRDHLEDQLDKVKDKILDGDPVLRDVLQPNMGGLRASMETLAVMQRVVDALNPRIVTGRNFAEPGSRAMFGTNIANPKFSLSVQDNSVGKGAVAVAGVYCDKDVKEVLRAAPRADIEAAVDTSEAQKRIGDGDDFQPLYNGMSDNSP